LPKSPALRSSLWGLNRARLLTAAIVVAVEYKEWTHDLHLRAPVYKGIEIDDPETITWAAEGPG